MTQTQFSADQIVNQFGAFKNAIINGDMRIAQRGTSFPAASSNSYMLDRWKLGNSTSAVFTVSQDSAVPSDQFQYSMKLLATTGAAVGAAEVGYIRQLIEGFNFRKFKGKTATLSFWIKAGKSGSFPVAFASSNPSDSHYYSMVTVNQADVWEFKSVTLDFDYVSGTWDYTNGVGLQVFWYFAIGSSYIGDAADTWQYSGSVYSDSGPTDFFSTTNDYINITGVQLELGSGATDFEFVDYGTQLHQCYRYYHELSSDINSRNMGMYNATNNYDLGYVFPVPMRLAPTATTLGTLANYRIRNLTSNIAPSTMLISTNLYAARIYGDPGVSVTTGQAMYMYPSSRASGDYITFDAEL